MTSDQKDDCGELGAAVKALGLDEEIAAIGTIIATLDPFDEKTIRRMLGYVCSRFGERGPWDTLGG